MGWADRSDAGDAPAPSVLIGADALLGAAICAFEDVAGGAHLPRHTWATQVLVEHLLDQLWESPWLESLSSAMWDPKRGVTSKVVDDATLRLMSASWLVSTGGRRDAAWMVTDAGRAQSRLMALSAADRAAVSEAAQRTLATTDAWLKNFRA